MKIKELKEQTKEDLVQREKSLKKEMFDLSFQRKYARVEKPGRFRMIRREIARIKTILNERQKDGRASTKK